MEQIKTAEELQSQNQEGKSQLVEDVTPEIWCNKTLSKAFKIMRYDNKHSIGS